MPLPLFRFFVPVMLLGGVAAASFGGLASTSNKLK
jgi:hypothetical protein